MKIALFLLAFVSSSAQALPRWITPDFAVSQAPKGFTKVKATPRSYGFFTDSVDPRDACEARLRQAICVTDADKQTIGDGWDKVSCSAASEDYLPAAMDLYDEMPARMRPLYCSLSRIFLSDNISNVAFATAIEKKYETVGAYIAARRDTFVRSPSTSQLVSWKEQVPFGGSDKFLANDPKLVQISYGLHMSHLKQDGLFYVVMHELGHIVDFQNNLTNSYSTYGWQSQSWITLSHADDDSLYYMQEKICYYDCGIDKVDPAFAYDIYSSLKKSAFITTYAGVNYMEDFAEFWAWNIMLESKNPDYRIRVPGHPEINMNSMFTDNPKVVQKMDIIRQIWNAPDNKIGF